MNSPLIEIPPMGIYNALMAFQAATGKRLGEPGTHPWSQGFPLLTGIPEAPSPHDTVTLSPELLKYPAGPGMDLLRNRIVEHYRNLYGAQLTLDQIQIVPGGRAGLAAVLALLKPEYRIALEETEYALYDSLLALLNRKRILIPSNEQNGFAPGVKEYAQVLGKDRNIFTMHSNPCNPTGRVLSGDTLQQFLATILEQGRAALIDEAYEFFVTPRPVSALEYLPNLEETNLFVVGAATKGLLAPGIRVGWVLASSKNIKMLRTIASILFGGVSQPSQVLAAELIRPERVQHSQRALARHYDRQRERYGKLLNDLGCTIFSGAAGFYHWAKLPAGMTAADLNHELQQRGAAVLSGTLFDMQGTGARPELEQFIRFSFGPLPPESFESDREILSEAFERCRTHGRTTSVSAAA